MKMRQLAQYIRQGGAFSSTVAVHLPWWHQPIFGCLMSFILVGLAIILVRLFLLREVHFVWIPFCLVSVVVGFIWGTSPALLATLLGFVAFNFFVIPQSDILTTNIWHDIRLLGPFVLAQCAIALLAAQNAVKYKRVLKAQQEIQGYSRELTTINQELERTNRLKDYIMTRAAHEFRTPLTSILGEAQLALRRLNRVKNSDVASRRSFEKVEARAKSLQALINELVILSSLRTKEAHLRYATCDFGKLCCETVEDLQAQTERQIACQIPAYPLILQADCERLFQVINNLVNNAIQYSPVESLISVDVSTLGESLLLRVHNEGNELTPEQQAHIFEPFYRTPFAEAVHHDGWGLGLTISRETVRRHGGEISVESQPGQGTSFLVELPGLAPLTMPA